MPGKRFGHKEEVTGNWRKLHIDDLRHLHSSPNIIRVIKSRAVEWMGLSAGTGEKRNVYRDLVVEPEGKRQLARPSSRWEDNIRMSFKEVGWETLTGFIWFGKGTCVRLL